MIKQRLYLTGLFMLLLSIKSYSQTSKALSLEEVWSDAFSTYPGLAEKQAFIKEARYQKKEVVNSFLPKVNIQLQNTYGTFAGSTGAFFPLPGIFNVNGNGPQPGQSSTMSNTYGSVLVDWKFIEFGKQRRQTELADTRIEEAENLYDNSKLSLQAKIARLYTDILYNQAKWQWAKENAIRIEKIVAISKTLAEAGLKAGADSLLAGSSYLQALGEQDEWAGKTLSSKIRLTELVPIRDSVFSLPYKSFLANNTILLMQDSVPADHPGLKLLSKQAESNVLQQKIAANALYPSISVLGGLSSRVNGAGKDGSLNNNWLPGLNNGVNNYLIGLGLSWNLSNAFNSFATKNKIKQQELAARSRYVAHMLGLNARLRSARARLSQQQKQIVKAAQAVANMQHAYELYVSRYQSGLINLTDLLQIQFLLQQSEKVNIEASQQLWELVIQGSEVSGNFRLLSNQFK